MDEAGIEAKGTAPVKPAMDSINAMKDKSQLPAVLGGLHRSGVNAFFDFGAEPDFKDSKVDIATADQGGLSLPDQGLLLQDRRQVGGAAREAAKSTWRRCSSCTASRRSKAAADAKTVMKVETDLAKASLDRTEQRDPDQGLPQDDASPICRSSAPLSPGTSTSPPSRRPRSTA